ncbi:MAG: hypothetical protein ACJ8KU_04235 [Chthoniobacterales bacterium]
MGLRWIAGGFGTPGLTDHESLEHELIVYDPLYAECKKAAGDSAGCQVFVSKQTGPRE